MKKILSLVLVLSMVLGSFGFAFAAPADVEGTDYEDAVTRLSALEILAGFPDGTFRPDETVTRAQFSKVMAHALGVGSAAQYANGATKFADVPAGHWASGYINVVSDMGVINGYGDGNFGPEDQVTYAQAVTMIVRALGYEPKAQAMGGYPGGYIAIAAEEEITEDVNIVNTLAATRGDVALMVDNSLTVPMMVQKTWGQYPEYEQDEDKTLMKTKLGVDEEEGRVVAVPNTESKLDENEIKLDNGKTYEMLVEGVNFDALLGLEVTVWEDGGDILDFDIDTDEDDIFFDTIAEDATNDEVSIYVEDETYDWAKDAKVYVNFKEVDEDEVKEGFYGYIVLNEDEEVAYANLFKFNEVNNGLVTELDDEEISFEGQNDLDLDDYEDGIYVYTKNFTAADIEDVDVDSVVYAWEDDEELYIVVVNEKVEGELEKAKDDEVEVDGTDYSVVADSTYSLDSDDEIDGLSDADKIEDLAGEAVEVVLDVNGDLRHIRGDVKETSDLIFGILVDLGDSDFAYKAKIFTPDGEEVVYKFEDKDDFGKALEGKLVAFELNKDGEIADGCYFEVNEGINDGEDLLADYEKAGFGPTVNADDDGFIAAGSDKAYIEDDTIIFNMDGNDPELVEWADIEDLEGLETNYIIVDDKGNDVAVVVFNNVQDLVNTDYEYAVVTADPWIANDGDWKVELDVFDSEETAFVVDSSIKRDAAFEEGNVIKFKLNADDEITEVVEITTQYTVQDTDKDGKYLEINNVWEKFDADAVIYFLDKDDDLEKIDYDEIEDGNTVIYDTDDDKIVVLLVVEDADPLTPPPTSVKGAVTYINDNNIAVDNIVYTFNSSSVLYNAAGTVAATGGTAINVLIDENDVLEDVVVADGIVKSLKLKVDASVVAADVLGMALGTDAEVAAARAAYDALVPSAKLEANAVTALDNIETAEAGIVDGLINAITDATPEAAKVAAARAAYDALTTGAKAKVTPALLAELEGYEADLAVAADAQEVIDLIKALPATITLADKSEVEAARDAYNGLSGAARSVVDADDTGATITILTDAETAIVELEAEVAAEAAVADAKAALTTLAVDKSTEAAPEIAVPVAADGVTYSFAAPANFNGNDVDGAATDADPVVITRDSATEFTFEIEVTITAEQDGGTTFDETTVSATKTFVVTVPSSLTGVTVEVK